MQNTEFKQDTQSDMPSKTLNPVYRGCMRHRDTLEYVTVDSNRVTELANEIALDDFDVPDWTQPVFPSQDADRETVVNFLLVGNILNFSFNDPETGRKYRTEYDGTEWPGAFGMWASLKRSLENDSLPTLTEPDEIENLTLDEAREVFSPVKDGGLPLLMERVRMLNSAGHTLNTEINGSFKTLVDRCDGELYTRFDDGLIDQLITYFESYRDRWLVNCREDTSGPRHVRFDKRAQLAAAMLYGRFQNEDYEATDFSDLNCLTVFADYGVPAVLNAEGVLDYHPEVEQRINNGSLFMPGESAEVEIRIGTVVAGEDLLSEINRIRGENGEPRIGIPELDYKLWSMRNDADCTTHLVQSTAY